MLRSPPPSAVPEGPLPPPTSGPLLPVVSPSVARPSAARAYPRSAVLARSAAKMATMPSFVHILSLQNSDRVSSANLSSCWSTNGSSTRKILLPRGAVRLPHSPRDRAAGRHAQALDSAKFRPHRGEPIITFSKHAPSATGPKVRRLAAGGEWIRTTSTAFHEQRFRDGVEGVISLPLGTPATERQHEREPVP